MVFSGNPVLTQAEEGANLPPQVQLTGQSDGPLPTIPEEPSDQEESEEDTALFAHDDPVMQELLAEVVKHNDFCTPVQLDPHIESVFPMYSCDMFDSYLTEVAVCNYHIVAANIRADLPWNLGVDRTPEFTEVVLKYDLESRFRAVRS